MAGYVLPVVSVLVDGVLLCCLGVGVCCTLWVVLAGVWLSGLGYCVEGVAVAAGLWMFALLCHLRVGVSVVGLVF